MVSFTSWQRRKPSLPSGRRLGETVVNSPGEESIYPSSESNSDSSAVQLLTYSVYRLNHQGCHVIRSSVLKYVGIYSCAPLDESVLRKRLGFHRRPEVTGSHNSKLGAQRITVLLRNTACLNSAHTTHFS